MLFLMRQWSSREAISHPKGKEVFLALDLLNKEDSTYKLKYSYDATYASLLYLSTLSIYRNNALSEALSREIEKDSINSLHSYNRAKDAAQEVLGALARATGSSLKEIQAKYEVDEEMLQ